jgi:hypothetical protein
MEAVRVYTFLRTDQRHPVIQPAGVRVMLLTRQPEGLTAQRLASYGSLLDIESGLDNALNRVIEDPMGYDLFVMDCDAYGGIDGAERAVAALIAAEARMRILLVSGAFDEPAYPLGRRSAVCLPDPADDDEFRYGYDHVLRDRPAMTIM